MFEVITAISPFILFGAVLTVGVYICDKKEKEEQQDEPSMVELLHRYEAQRLVCDGQHIQCSTCTPIRRARLEAQALSGRPGADLAKAVLRLGEDN